MNDESKIVKVIFWYFRQQRSWVVQRLDAEGNQVSNADYVYSQREAKFLKSMYEKQYNI